jgi:hypothetical protein
MEASHKKINQTLPPAFFVKLLGFRPEPVLVVFTFLEK